MSFCSFSKEYSRASFTGVENIFITSYLKEAQSDAIKVYLYGLYLCQNRTDDEYSIDTFCDSLKLSREIVIDSFKYWEEFGLVDIISDEPFSVKFLPIGLEGAKPRKINTEKYTQFNNSLQNIITGRMIGTNEFSEYFRLIETYNIKQEAMLMIVQYCVNLKGPDIGCNYISAVAKAFALKGITTPEKVEKELENYIVRSGEISKILSALSLKRAPEVDDVKLLEKWLGELGFEFDSVIAAAKKVKRGGIKKLDDFLLELYNNKRFSVKEIDDWSKQKRNVIDLAIKINNRLSVYCEVMDTVVDNYTTPWLNKGYGEQELLFLADYCFRHNKKSHEEMNDIINALYSKGLVSIESIADYFKQVFADDAFLKVFLDKIGITRKPTDWDRKNLATWRGWGFSDEMIELAGTLTYGKMNPIPYMNAVLSTWKNKGIFSIEQAQAEKSTYAQSNTRQVSDKSGHFALERNYSKEELDKLIDDVDDIEI